MGKVRKIIRKFGCDIVRFPSEDQDMLKNNPVTSLETIKETGKLMAEVARQQLPAFEPFDRPVKSTTALDQLENNWWNDYGDLIEKVWVLEDDINTELRQDYVSKAKQFFLSDTPKTKILDLGCGSGWMGRMLADENVEYVGVDFSETQIKIANDTLVKSGIKHSIKYHLTKDFTEVEDLDSVTGVVINAFLHHLYWDELDELFKGLVHHLPKGCKVYILEPVYPSLSKKSGATGNEASKLVGGALNLFIGQLKKQLVQTGKYDVALDKELEGVINESNAMGYFFSPKEVPFQMDKFRKFLNKYISVDNIYPTGIHDIAFAQMCSKITDDKLRSKVISAVFPAVKLLDKMLLELEGEQDSNMYLFTAFECKIKA